MAQGTFNTVRATARDRYPDRADDGRRVRAIDAARWAADVAAEAADAALWADVAADVVDPAGTDRYGRAAR